jgi:hypothetical protein
MGQMTREELAKARERVAAADRYGRSTFRPDNQGPAAFDGWYDAVFPTRSFCRDRKIVMDAIRREAGREKGER